MTALGTDAEPEWLDRVLFPGAWYLLMPNAQGQTIWLGDSGGPCFVEEDGESYISGVHVMAAYNDDEQEVLYSWDASAYNYYDWTYDRSERMTASVTYTSTWGSGYCAEVTVTNNGSVVAASWEAVFDLNDSQIYTSWSADFTTAGSVVTAKSLYWNGDLAGGASRVSLAGRAERHPLPGLRGTRSRRIVSIHVTSSPSASWAANQVVQAFPGETALGYLLRDRDGIYGARFRGLGGGQRGCIVGDEWGSRGSAATQHGWRRRFREAQPRLRRARCHPRAD